MTVNAGDLIDIIPEKLPISSISVFVTGFAAESVQDDNDELFKSIRIIVTEFIRNGGSGKKFHVKCRYLKSDERIHKKLTRVRKSSNLMITGELIHIESEFKIDIQDVNFLPMSIANMESLSTSPNNSPSSQYSWSTTEQPGRMSAQAMANASVNSRISETQLNQTPTPPTRTRLTRTSKAQLNQMTDNNGSKP